MVEIDKIFIQNSVKIQFKQRCDTFVTTLQSLWDTCSVPLQEQKKKP
jgi:hypothetical protein